ncbi:MAG: murein biosynthesis integral membrane protein MurJ [Actinomycetota bacterium]|jgi:putative peptidoglycan lipid II flippase|nr:murein biosynthesis integral membrane protein MurJ [Actinomycetota bacterium]
MREALISKPSIARSTATMSVSTALSRVTGFVRTWAIAYALGVTAFAASYGVANNIPNMIYELVAGGVISSLFIPVLIERRERGGEEDAWKFASYLINLTAIGLGIVAILGTVFAESFVRTQTFRISVEDAALATYFFRFFAIQVVFYGVGAVISGALNAERKFAWPAMGPIFNNLVVIVTLLGFYVPFHSSDPELAKMGLAIGTTLGVLAQVAVQVPALIKLGFRYTPKIDFKHPGLRSMGRLFIPTTLYVVTNLVGVSFRNAYAFEASPEGPATLLYAWMFYQLPYGIFAVALATAIFTELSGHAEATNWTAFKSTFSKGLRATGILIIPMSAMLIALSRPLITLYQAGRFTADDVPVVAEILMWWAVALFFFAAYMFVLKTFYSLQDTRTPMIANAVLTVLQVSLYAGLTTGFGGWGGVGLKGIPMADAIFFALSLVTLLTILYRRLGGFDVRVITWSLGRVAVASMVGGLAAWWITSVTSDLLSWTGGFLVQLAFAGVAGLSITYGLAVLMRVREVSVAADMARRVLGRLIPGRRA